MMNAHLMKQYVCLPVIGCHVINNDNEFNFLVYVQCQYQVCTLIPIYIIYLW